MKKYVSNALVGMGFGFPITLLCMTLFGGYNAVVREFLVWMIASALYGILATVMDNGKNELPMPVSLGIHFFGCVAITLGAAFLNGYLTGLADVLPILIPTLAIYVAICGICFWLMKKNEKEVNKALENK